MKNLTISLLASALAGGLVLGGAHCSGDDMASEHKDIVDKRDLSSSPNGDMAMNQPEDLSPPPDLSLGVPREFMVVRIGDGNAKLTSAAAPVFVERRQVSDGLLVVPPVAMPTAVSADGKQKRLVMAGNQVSEGFLTRSYDGRYVTLVGYDADVATLTVVTATTPSIPARVIGRVSGDDKVDTSTTITMTTANVFRSAISTNGTDFWAAGATGAFYVPLGGTAVNISTVTTLRQMQIVDGQLYGSRAQNNATGINKIGTGIQKTAAQTLTMLTGMPSATANGDPYGFAMFDLNPNIAGADTIYIADNGTTTDRGIQRWSLDGTGTWKNTGSFMGTAPTNQVIGYQDGSKVVLVAVTRTTPSAIISVTDDGTTDPATVAATTLTTSATNMAYRGIAFSPTL